MVGNKIFRQVSLERLSSPEQLDLLMKVTQPKSWLALFAILCLLAAAMVWAVTGRIPVEVNAPAIILPVGGIKSVIALNEGQITALYVSPGDLVEAEQLIGEVTPLGQSVAEPIISPFSGRVIELKIGSGHWIDAGTAVASLEPVGENRELEAIMYIPRADAQQLQPNMVVKLASESAPVEEYGYLLGQIVSVGEFPISNQGIVSRIGSKDLAAFFSGAESPVEIRIALLTDANTASGLKWTTSTGPNYTIGSGTLASATIVVDQQRPVDLFLAR